MRISRRGLGTVAAGVALGLVTGCSSKDPGEARLQWLGGLDGVERAELVKDSDDDELILLTLVKRLPRDDVKALVDKIKSGFRRYDDGYFSSIEVDLDGFHGKFYPSTSAKSDADLERALWLREDGRATSSTYGVYGVSGLLVTAPAPKVAAVALGLDAAVPSEDGRRTHRVESADHAVVVEWTDSPSLGFRLDRAATQEFARLQARYPGLTGWIKTPDLASGVYFAASDLELDALLAAPPKAATFGKLELGWGLVRAPEPVFTAAFTPPVRKLIAELAKFPGVTGLQIRDDEGKPKADSVVVKDRAGFLAAVTTLRRFWSDYLSIDLIRKPSARFVGRPGNAVFSTSSFHQATEFRINSAVADNLGVVKVEIGPQAANLIITQTITAKDLTQSLQAIAQLPATHKIALYASTGVDDSGVIGLGRIANRKYVAENPAPAVDPSLVTRLSSTWAQVSR